MRLVSWVLLCLVTLLMVLGSIGSAAIAYFADPSNDVLVGSTSLADLELEAEVKEALRGRRGTAAAMGLGFSTLLLILILGPYRKGEVWAWWAILAGVVVTTGTMLLRFFALENPLGVTTALILLGLFVIGLALDARRLSSAN